jgi:hypothetical protein
MWKIEAAAGRGVVFNRTSWYYFNTGIRRQPRGKPVASTLEKPGSSIQRKVLSCEAFP